MQPAGPDTTCSSSAPTRCSSSSSSLVPTTRTKRRSDAFSPPTCSSSTTSRYVGSIPHSPTTSTKSSSSAIAAHQRFSLQIDTSTSGFLCSMTRFLPRALLTVCPTTPTKSRSKAKATGRDNVPTFRRDVPRGHRVVEKRRGVSGWARRSADPGPDDGGRFLSSIRGKRHQRIDGGLQRSAPAYVVTATGRIF